MKKTDYYYLSNRKIWNEVAQSKAIRRTELEISWPSLDSSAMRNPLLREALLLSFNVIFNLPTNILPSFFKKIFRSPHFTPRQCLYPVRSPLSAVRGQWTPTLYRMTAVKSVCEFKRIVAVWKLLQYLFNISIVFRNESTHPSVSLQVSSLVRL